MKKRILQFGLRKKALTLGLIFTSFLSSAQTNVFDDIISTSPNHTSLTAALVQEGLDVALQDNMATLTVFAPDNAAFDDLAAALNTDIMGLLALPNLSDILLYHVLGVSAQSSGINNGDIVTPLNAANTIKLTKTSGGDVYANQAMVNGADLTADNGVVHSLGAVILPYETVVDVAIDNGFTSLTTAVVTAELLPALTNPLASLTVFAPDNTAFDNLATALNTDINGLLALPNLSDILTYHVLGIAAQSTGINNGDIVTPLNAANTIKLTKTSGGSVYANQAMVSLADLTVDNGVVHAIDAVILPYETVVDVAIDNGFTTLTTAVVTAELLPALTNPLASLTVFAPDNMAFDNLVNELGTDLNGLLAMPELADILLYHVVDGTVLSTDLTNGLVPTLNGQDINVDLSTGVMINDANVAIADLVVDNGVVHAIDAVLLPSSASIDEEGYINVLVFPNPSTDKVTVDFNDDAIHTVELTDMNGALIERIETKENSVTFDTAELSKGTYMLILTGDAGKAVKTLQLQ